MINLRILKLVEIFVKLSFIAHILGCGWWCVRACQHARARAREGARAGVSPRRPHRVQCLPSVRPPSLPHSYPRYMHMLAADDEPTWVSEYDGGSALEAPLSKQYLYCLYWSLTTMSTVCVTPPHSRPHTRSREPPRARCHHHSRAVECAVRAQSLTERGC